MVRKKSINVSFFGALAVLMGLILSSIIPTQTEAFQNNSETVSENSPQTVRLDYGKMPLLFEANKGQTDEKAKFVSRGAGYTLYLAETEAVFSLKVESGESKVESHSENPKTKDRRPFKTSYVCGLPAQIQI